MVNKENLQSIPALFLCGTAKREIISGTRKSGSYARLWELVCQILFMIQSLVEKKNLISSSAHQARPDETVCQIIKYWR